MNMPPKNHVFISHSTRDDVIGRRVCTTFEENGIRCWYSSRSSDLEPGVEWDDNIVAALDRSIAVILIFSAAANASKWVKRELAMAEARDVPIYPIRIEDIKPTGGMEAHLISVQWTEAFFGPIEERLEPILRKLRSGVTTAHLAPAHGAEDYLAPKLPRDEKESIETSYLRSATRRRGNKYLLLALMIAIVLAGILTNVYVAH